MSFRVWFLRMVWIVAAAVALGGCGDDDDNGDDENGNGEGGPKLAVAADPASVPATAEGTARKVKVTATISGKPEGDEVEVEVTLSVKCGTDDYAVKAEDSKKNIKGDGSASWDLEGLPDVETGTDSANITCTLTAKAESFDDATGTFTLAKEAPAAPGGGTPSWGLTLISDENGTALAAAANDDNDNSTDFMVGVTVSKGAGDTVTGSGFKVELKYFCQADATPEIPETGVTWRLFTTADWAVTTSTSFDANKSHLAPKAAQHNASAGQDCYIRAEATIGGTPVTSDPVKFIDSATA